jgi:hypothetical protein
MSVAIHPGCPHLSGFWNDRRCSWSQPFQQEIYCCGVERGVYRQCYQCEICPSCGVEAACENADVEADDLRPK